MTSDGENSTGRFCRVQPNGKCIEDGTSTSVESRCHGGTQEAQQHQEGYDHKTATQEHFKKRKSFEERLSGCKKVHGENQEASEVSERGTKVLLGLALIVQIAVAIWWTYGRPA